MTDPAAALEELIVQRDAVLLGRWVQSTPRNPGEACLVQRGLPTKHEYAEVVLLNRPALLYILRARMGVETISLTSWNDTPGRSIDEVLDLLDRAITLAKEDLDGHQD